jgi:acetyl esterase/lipase
VPHPQWVRVEEIEIPKEKVDEAASVLQEQLGPEGIAQVGGKNWWQWRKPNTPLAAEWIEMKSDYHERKNKNDTGKRVMLYVHGGAYFFGSVDEHRYQVRAVLLGPDAIGAAPQTMEFELIQDRCNDMHES